MESWMVLLWVVVEKKVERCKDATIETENQQDQDAIHQAPPYTYIVPQLSV